MWGRCIENTNRHNNVYGAVIVIECVSSHECITAPAGPPTFRPIQSTRASHRSCSHYIYTVMFWSPTANNVVIVLVFVVVIKFSKHQNFSVSQPIVIKLRLRIGDNIPAFSTVLDFYVKSRLICK